MKPLFSDSLSVCHTSSMLRWRGVSVNDDSCTGKGLSGVNDPNAKKVVASMVVAIVEVIEPDGLPEPVPPMLAQLLLSVERATRKFDGPLGGPATPSSGP